MKRLDILILGATGLTGKNCIPVMHELVRYNGHNFTWGIAGRSANKLQQILNEMSIKIDKNLSNIPIIICNIDDSDSLLKMAQKARVVVNCVGPFIIHGEQVVDACLKAGTHHIDISGEPQFMENMQLKKHSLAKEKGVYIVSGCGMDSIPNDLGTVYVAQKFTGGLNSIVTYLKLWTETENSGPFLNYTTWKTLVNNLSHINELRKLRKDLFQKKIPKLEPKLVVKTKPHRTNIVDGWMLPFPGADRSVMKRTQRYFYEVKGKRPIQVDSLMVFTEKTHIVLALFTSIVLFILSKFHFGRKLLLSHPKIFSFGIFGKETPSENLMENSWFELIFHGEGWKEESSKANNLISKPCNRRIIARMKGRNPGYGFSCICAVGSAVTLLSENDKLPGNARGGVYTPGVAFANTSLMKLLLQNGLEFEILSEENMQQS